MQIDVKVKSNVLEMHSVLSWTCIKIVYFPYKSTVLMKDI